MDFSKISLLMPIIFVILIIVMVSPFISENYAEGNTNNFYISPKIFLGKHKTSFGDSSYELAKEPDETIGYIPLGHGRWNTQGINSNNSLTFGGIALGVSLFNRFKIPIRLELEVSTRADVKVTSEASLIIVQNEAENSQHQTVFPEDSITLWPRSLSYTIHTIFFNIFLDIKNKTQFTPYLGGGLGLAFITGKGEIIGGNRLTMQNHETLLFLTSGSTHKPIIIRNRIKNFSYHVDIGVSYDITENVAIDLAGRYTNFGKSLKSKESDVSKYSEEYVCTPNCSYNNHTIHSFLYGPSEIKFEPVFQGILGIKYSFM
jgi:opacity protein-like surface antigen